MAGTDCGFGTWVGQAAVDPDIVWAKLGSLAEGARLASREPGAGAGRCYGAEVSRSARWARRPSP